MNTPEQELIPLSSKERWTSRLNEIPHHYAHSWEHCHAMFLTTGYPTFLYSFSLDDKLVLCPICERTFQGYTDIVTPYGFNGFVSNGDCPEFNAYWKEFAKDRGYVCGYIGLNPLFNNDLGFTESEIRSQNEIFLLDLTIPLGILIERMDINRRRQYKRMAGIEASLTVDRERLSAFFVNNYESFMKEKSATGTYHFSSSTLESMADCENIMMTGFVENDQVQAVSLFGYSQYAADFLFNISTEKGKDGSFAVMWLAIEKLSSMNIPILNLGGGVKQGDSLSMFKKRFGGEVKPLRSLQQVFDNVVFQQLCKEKGVDKTAASYFPPYRSGQKKEFN